MSKPKPGVNYLRFCVIGFLLPICLGDLEPTMNHCCILGGNLASKELQCDISLVPTPVQGVPEEQQSICLLALQLCCVRALREIRCTEGKTAALIGEFCQSDANEDRKYCCEACKLGLISGSMAVGCRLRTFTVGHTWNAAYEQCCVGVERSSNATMQAARQPARDAVTENFCELYSGELCAHICLSTPGSYSCACHRGFSLMTDGKSCQQDTTLDRCQPNNPCSQNCLDTGLAIECYCYSGYQLQQDNQTCIDIDECALGLDNCIGSNQRCQNGPGSYSCIENTKSYVQQPSVDQRKPKASDEHSHCPMGFKYNTRSAACNDVDECEDSLHICNPEQEICINVAGGYRCEAKRGIATSRSPKITCPIGFKYSTLHRTCVDINECMEAEETACDSTQQCENTIGSFNCKCKQGFHLDPITQACTDINECQVDHHNCESSQRCDNTIGSYHCVRYTNCGTGYTLNANTGLCEDDDECLLGTDTCHFQGAEWQCRNTLGSFRCERKREITCGGRNCTSTRIVECPRGYQLVSSGHCIDINECEHGVNCNANERCVNTAGSYTCSNIITCQPGLKLNEAKTYCVDIDECVEQARLCDHNCINIRGGFRCICRSGFTLYNDNRTCVDINECEIYKNRPLCRGYCINEPGSYSCQCPDGYRIGKDGASCQDIDECARGGFICTNPNEACTNMRGSHRCSSIACPSGYVTDERQRSKCKRTSLTCESGDNECLRRPMTISFHFITLVANYSLPTTGQLDLFTMRAAIEWPTSTVDFKLDLADAITLQQGVVPANLDYFRLIQTSPSQANLALVRPLQGPQDIHLHLSTEFFYNSVFSGTTLSKITILVSQYEY